MLKKILFSILTVLIFFITIFLIVEVAIRLFMPQVHPMYSTANMYQDSLFASSRGLAPGKTGYSMGAKVKVDNYGFRAGSIAADTCKPAWLLLGDSVTMGVGVAADSTFAARQQVKKDSLTILNPSIYGNSISNYKNIFDHIAIQKKLPFDVRYVTMFWCLNDIYFNMETIEQPGSTLRKFFPSILSYLRAHSRTYLFLKATLFDRPATYYKFDEKFYTLDNAYFQSTVKIITEINRLSRENNIKFEIVFFPYEYQLRDKTNKFEAQELLASELEKNQIKVIRIYQQFEKGLNSKDYFLFGDGIHFSNLGHCFVSNAMER